MWSTPRSTASRSTAIALARSRGGPKTFGPVSRIAPNPIGETENGPSRRSFTANPRSGWFEDDNGDLSIGLGLIVGEAGIVLLLLDPDGVALISGGGAGAEVAGVGADL